MCSRSCPVHSSPSSLGFPGSHQDGRIPTVIAQKLSLFSSVFHPDILTLTLMCALHLQCKYLLHSCKRFSLILFATYISLTPLSLHDPTMSFSQARVHISLSQLSHSVSRNSSPHLLSNFSSPSHDKSSCLTPSALCGSFSLDLFSP